MSAIRIILEDLQQVRRYTNDLLDHIDVQLWFRQPAEGINHIAWQVGHLAVVEYSLCLKRVRGEQDTDDTFIDTATYARLFGKGSQPSPRAEDYPTSAEIRQTLDAVHEEALAHVERLTEDDLAAACGPPHPLFSTKEGSLRFCAKHEMLHTGQIALLRRLFGGEILR